MFHDPSFAEVLSSLAILKFLPLIGFWSPGFDYRPRGYWKRVVSKFKLDDVGILLYVRGDALSRLTLTEFLKVLKETSSSVQLKLERRGVASDRYEVIPVSHVGVQIVSASTDGLSERPETVPLKDFRKWWRRCGEKMQNFSYVIPGHFLTEPKRCEVRHEEIIVPVTVLSTREHSELLPGAIAELVSGRNGRCVSVSTKTWF